jgi:hypothetical protein
MAGNHSTASRSDYQKRKDTQMAIKSTSRNNSVIVALPADLRALVEKAAGDKPNAQFVRELLVKHFDYKGPATNTRTRKYANTEERKVAQRKRAAADREAFKAWKEQQKVKASKE